MTDHLIEKAGALRFPAIFAFRILLAEKYDMPVVVQLDGDR